MRTADIADCERVLEVATRDAVKQALRLKLSQLTTQRDSRVAALSAAAAKEAARAAAAASAGAGAGTARVDYMSLPTFAWDEVCIYDGG